MVTKTEVEKWRDGLRSAVKERDFQKAEEYIREGRHILLMLLTLKIKW